MKKTSKKLLFIVLSIFFVITCGIYAIVITNSARPQTPVNNHLAANNLVRISTSTTEASKKPTVIKAAEFISITAPVSSSKRLLGSKLGPAALYMPEVEALKMLGEPKQRSITHGIGTPEWEYANGLTVAIAGSPKSKYPDAIWKIIATAPSGASTSEGFSLGDSASDFKRIYQNFDLIECAFQCEGYQLGIKDSSGKFLNAVFDDNKKATIIVLSNEILE